MSAYLTMARRIRLWAVLGTLLACGILLGTVAVVNVEGLSSGSPGLTPSQLTGIAQSTLKNLESAAKSDLSKSAFSPVLSGGLTPLTVQAMAERLFGPYAYVAQSIPLSFWSLVVAQATGHGTTLTSALHAATGGLDGLLAGLFLGESAVLVGACVAAAILSLGLGCVAILAGVAIAGAVLYVMGLFCSAFGWGCSSSNANVQEEEAADNLAIVMLGDAGYAADIQAQAMVNELQALNLTYTALSYEASAAALSQLPNASFSPGLDLSQGGVSSVAAQLSSVYFADATTVYSGIFTRVLTQFSSEEGYGNTYTYYCPLQVGSTVIPAPTQYLVATPQSYDCGQSAPSTYYWAQGLVTPGDSWVVGPGSLGSYSDCPELYIATASAITYGVNPGQVLDLYPVDGAPVITMTVPTYGPSGTGTDAGMNLTFAGPSGGYWVCTTGTDSPDVVAVYFTDAFPLNATTATVTSGAPHEQSAAPSGVWDQSGNGNAELTTSSDSNKAVIVDLSGAADIYLAGLGTGGAPYAVGLAGGNTNSSEYAGSPNTASVQYAVQGNLMTYLYHLATLAATVGQTYWAFLRALGYTSESQVPIRCIVPAPSALIPPNIPLSTLEAMNVTTMLNWYLTMLYGLGQTFNLSYALTDATFCDHKLPPFTGGGMGFGTFALGYVYVPAATKSSDGLVSQKYSTPSTYNISGEIYIAPALGNYSIPIGQRFILGENNPVALFVQPFVKATKTGGTGATGLIVNRTAPTYCAPLVTLGHGNTTYGFSVSTGCNTTAEMSFVTGLVAGNSSADQGLSGSVYPASVDPKASTANITVFLTGCFMAASGSPVDNLSWTFRTSGNCGFSDAILNNTGLNCNGNVLYSGGQVIGQCVSPPKVLVVGNENCGLSFLSVLAGYFSILGATWSCVVAWVIFIVIIIAVIAVIFYVVRIVREGV